jgi:hypothetical protein
MKRPAMYRRRHACGLPRYLQEFIQFLSHDSLSASLLLREKILERRRMPIGLCGGVDNRDWKAMLLYCLKVMTKHLTHGQGGTHP